ncbi:MAG: ATP-binding cassette domain-containing protein [Pseudomonadota bacterium]
MARDEIDLTEAAATNHIAPALTLDRVSKVYGSFRAVDDLSFQVKPGEIFGFLGPNGAGKTTTLRMILNIINPTSGSIDVLGAPSDKPQRARIGYLPEERGLYRKMRAADSIAYFAQLRGVPGPTAKKRAFELLDRFGLGDFAKSKNEALSKGMAQKVQLLATIAHEPEFLILDEPFSGLDPLNQGGLEDLIRSFKSEGRTVIFSTHVMSHAERLCDRFLILAKGEKRFEGTLTEARSAFPQPILLRTEAPLDRLKSVAIIQHVSLVEGAVGDSGHDFHVQLVDGAKPKDLIKVLTEQGIEVTRFDASAATLHDIFVEIAGDHSSPASLGSDQGVAS